jgi:large subunit ribosomal protein L23
MASRSAQQNTARQVSNDSRVLRPRITEKATYSAELHNVYVFDIATKATKRDVAAFVAAAYKVTPIKVTTARVPSKRVVYRGKRGVKPAGKKAYVYLKRGDKIEIV